jgi:DNA polymerase-1
MPEWRTIFTADPGEKIVVADYSQAELRILTELSHDEYFTNAYKNKIDMHKMTASKIYNKPIENVTDEERSICKTVNFGLTYGMGANALQRRLKTDSGIEISDEQAKETVAGFYTAYPGVAKYLEYIERQGLADLQVKTKAGRLMKFDPPADESEESMIRRLSKNLPIQGLCADIVKKALGNLFLELEPKGVKLLAVVHDEIVMSCPEELATEVKGILEVEMKKASEGYITTVPFYAEGKIADYWQH